jgi:hypothetical protein
MNTVYGILADSIGLAAKKTLEQGPHGPELRFRASAGPAGEYRSVQDPEILVDRDHDHRWVGAVKHLERRNGCLWCVAEVSDDVTPAVHVRVGDKTVAVDHPLYWSAERIGGGDDGLLLRAVALTPSPARVSARPVTFQPGGLGNKSSWVLDSSTKGLLDRAYEASLTRHGRPIRIHEPNHYEGRTLHPAEKAQILEDQFYEGYDVAWKHRPLEYRPSRIIAVR